MTEQSTGSLSPRKLIPAVEQQQYAAAFREFVNVVRADIFEGRPIMQARQKGRRTSRPIAKSEVDWDDRIVGQDIARQLQQRCCFARSRRRNKSDFRCDFESRWQLIFRSSLFR
jgi:hypothetical protein